MNTTTEQKRHRLFPVMTFSELIDECDKEERELEKRVRLHTDGKQDYIMLDGHYAIELDRISTPDKVITWVLHLTEKAWVSTMMIHRMIELAAVYHNMPCRVYC